MSEPADPNDQKFIRGLGLLDSTMLVAGSMIGSGVFIVSSIIARQVGAPGWLLVVWIITGFLTLTAALSYGELAAMMPKAGGQYVYLREAFSPLWGFLYGWTLFLVIQTGTIAAVAVGFARYTGVLVPWVSESNYLIAPIRFGGYSVSYRQGHDRTWHASVRIEKLEFQLLKQRFVEMATKTSFEVLIARFSGLGFAPYARQS